MKKQANPSLCLEKQKETIDMSERIFFKRILSLSEQDVNFKPWFLSKVFKKNARRADNTTDKKHPGAKPRIC